MLYKVLYTPLILATYQLSCFPVILAFLILVLVHLDLHELFQKHGQHAFLADQLNVKVPLPVPPGFAIKRWRDSVPPPRCFPRKREI